MEAFCIDLKYEGSANGTVESRTSKVNNWIKMNI